MAVTPRLVALRGVAEVARLVAPRVRDVDWTAVFRLAPRARAAFLAAFLADRRVEVAGDLRRRDAVLLDRVDLRADFGAACARAGFLFAMTILSATLTVFG
ncbi:MAG: hypothetical protein LC791_01720 [Acidobacteria bacterium]|nr:hypothetical protein [Acidobacteriota bacterium]